jgi:hypothetical protein
MLTWFLIDLQIYHLHFISKHSGSCLSAFCQWIRQVNSKIRESNTVKNYIFIHAMSKQKIMNTFLIKAILISSGSVANIDIGLFLKNLTYALLKSFCEKDGSCLMSSSKSSKSVVLLTSGLTVHGCNQPEMKYSLSISTVFSIFVYSTS